MVPGILIAIQLYQGFGYHELGEHFLMAMALGGFAAWMCSERCKQRDLSEDTYIQKTEQRGWFWPGVRRSVVEPLTRWFRKSFVRNFTILGCIVAFFAWVNFFVVGIHSRCRFENDVATTTRCVQMVRAGQPIDTVRIKLGERQQPQPRPITHEPSTVYSEESEDGLGSEPFQVESTDEKIQTTSPKRTCPAYESWWDVVYRVLFQPCTNGENVLQVIFYLSASHLARKYESTILGCLVELILYHQIHNLAKEFQLTQQ